MAADQILHSAQRTWRAMGSTAHIIVVGASVDEAEALTQQAVTRIEELESRWSRFRPDSEICRLNNHSGSPVEVSPDTVTLVTLAVEGWRLTGGGFDPLLLDALVDAGYDRDLDEVRSGNATDHAAPLIVPRGRAAHPAGRGLRTLVACTDIEISGGTVVLPASTSFDGGGIGKGLAADLVLDEVMRAGALGALVNLGGDLRVRGLSPEGGAWTLGIEHPHQADPITLVGVAGGAIASSTTLLRRWTANGAEQHHLIDPHTGEPSESDITFASVIAAEAWEAEVLAKAVLLRGTERAFDLLVPGRHAALIVDRDGNIRTSEGFAAFTGGTVPTQLDARTNNIDMTNINDTEGVER